MNKTDKNKIIVSVTNDLVADNRVHKVCTSLINMGFDILLIGRKLPKSLPLNIRDYQTKRFNLIFKTGALFYAEYNFRLFLFLLFAKFNVLLANDLDSLTANFLASKIKNKPLVYDSHEYFTEVPELINRPKTQRIWQWLEQKMVPKIKYAYTVCNSIAKIYEEKYGTEFKVVRNIPKAIKTTVVKDENPTKIILYQGAVNIGRGLEQAILAMKYINRAKLIIAGDGDIKTQLESLVEKENLLNRVEFTGRLPIEELAKLTPQADLGLSIEEDLGLNYRFALPNKLFDYIQAQVPVLVTNLPEMVAIVKGLLQKGYAYTVDGDVFFSVKKFPSYGKLSRRKLDEMRAGARVEVDARKSHPLDFALWKKAKEDEPFWESPWGKGRPGWHIECSAMSMKYLGESLDIHGGGQDLIFPHHENEIAQSEAYTGKQFSRYWLHNGFVTVDKEKMSKSLGNFFTLEEIFEKYEPQVVRLFLISTHYRHPIDFNNEELEEAKRRFERMMECDRKLKNLAPVSSKPQKSATRFRREFETHMDNDFNTSGALAIIFDMMKYLNTEIGKGNTGSEEFINVAREFVELREVLGIITAGDKEFPHEVRVGEKEKPLSDEEVEKLLSIGSEMSDSDVEKLIIQRELARKACDWEKADKIRSKLSEFARIQDAPDKTLWRRKK